MRSNIHLYSYCVKNKKKVGILNLECIVTRHDKHIILVYSPLYLELYCNSNLINFYLVK